MRDSSRGLGPRLNGLAHLAEPRRSHHFTSATAPSFCPECGSVERRQRRRGSGTWLCVRLEAHVFKFPFAQQALLAYRQVIFRERNTLDELEVLPGARFLVVTLFIEYLFDCSGCSLCRIACLLRLRIRSVCQENGKYVCLFRRSIEILAIIQIQIHCGYFRMSLQDLDHSLFDARLLF